MRQLANNIFSGVIDIFIMQNVVIKKHNRSSGILYSLLHFFGYLGGNVVWNPATELTFPIFPKVKHGDADIFADSTMSDNNRQKQTGSTHCTCYMFDGCT